MTRRRIVLCVATLALLAGAVWLGREVLRERRVTGPVTAAAARYRVDPNLVRAVMWQESRLRPDARGTHGELGLMQVRDIAAREWAESEHLKSFQHFDCLNPATNAFAGTFYLGKLLKRYGSTDDPVPYALADYNAGRGNVLKWNSGAAATNSSAFIRQIGFPQTHAYVRAIQRRREWYAMLARWGVL